MVWQKIFEPPQNVLGLTEREAAALARPRLGVGENYPLAIDENTTNVDSEPPECKTQ